MKVAYRVTFVTAKANLTPEYTEKLTKAILAARFNPSAPEVQEIASMAISKEKSIQLFAGAQPLESRNAALSYASSLCEVICQHNQEGSTARLGLRDMAHHGIDISATYSEVYVDLLFDDEEITIGQSFMHENLLLNWERELRIYQANSFAVEGEPYQTYVPHLKRYISTLPLYKAPNN